MSTEYSSTHAPAPRVQELPTITATELVPLPGVADWVPVLACRDNCIRARVTRSAVLS